MYPRGTFPPGQHELAIPGEPVVSAQGQTLINRFLAENKLPLLPAGFDYRTKIPGLPNLVTRISKYLHDYCRHNLSTWALAYLGDLITQNTTPDLLVRFDFTQNFDWRSGDFGDKGSCYWTSYSHARTVIRNAGGYAIRFYSSDDPTRGVGRAWILPVYKRLHSAWLVFNGYGQYGRILVRAPFLAQVFMGFWENTLAQEVNAHNRGWTRRGEHALYLNYCKHLLVGDPKEIQTKITVSTQIGLQRHRCQYSRERTFNIPTIENGKVTYIPYQYTDQCGDYTFEPALNRKYYCDRHRQLMLADKPVAVKG